MLSEPKNAALWWQQHRLVGILVLSTLNTLGSTSASRAVWSHLSFSNKRQTARPLLIISFLKVFSDHLKALIKSEVPFTDSTRMGKETNSKGQYWPQICEFSCIFSVVKHNGIKFWALSCVISVKIRGKCNGNAPQAIRKSGTNDTVNRGNVSYHCTKHQKICKHKIHKSQR